MAAMAAATRARAVTFVAQSRAHVAACVGPVVVPRRNSTTDVVNEQRHNLAAYKRGRGGRSSFSGIVATVFGASGFMGRYVVNKLGKLGSQIICPYRGDPYYMKELKLAGDLGQVLFLPYHLRDEESIRKVIKYSNVVINLVGREWETRNFTYEDVHWKGAQRIARLARESGVEKLVHVSHLNAQPNPPSIYVKGGSEFLKSKHHGEEAVRDEFPDAIILRPADIYGQEDRFLTYYANRWRRSFGTMPLWKRGTQTVKMPVYVSDVAEGIVNAIQDHDAVGKTYECVGPHSYYMSDLIDYIYRVLRHPYFRRSFMTPIFKMKVMFLSRAPATPICTMDKLDREHVSNILTGLPTLEDLGVNLTKLEDRIQWELNPYRAHRYYEEKVGEFAAPAPPPVITT